ncbi:MAG: Asp-tRNA(Asn)/Glu-tRNA(Gln) amidotransferase subunit GatA [Patescibacteria group bacterium]
MLLNELTIKEAREKLDTGDISSVALTEACLKAIEEKNPELNAVLTVCREEALLEAKKADEKLKAGERAPLLGIPYLAKDILMTKGIRTTAASKILDNYFAPYDAAVIAKLKESGAVLLGKTNLDEFAHGASTENSAYGVTKNPHDFTRVAGGSSGGSSAAVAANLCLFALGTDTGGSIRQPSAFCGVVGFKPSYGRVSRFGLLSMTSSTDVAGPITKTVEDAKFVFEVIEGKDEHDATSIKVEEKNDFKNLASLKIGLPKEYLQELKNEEVKKALSEAIKKLKLAGVTVEEVSLPNARFGVPVYYIVTPSEISSNLARFDGIAWGVSDDTAASLHDFYLKARGQGFGAETKRRIMLGTYALSAGYFDSYYKKAQSVRALIIEDFNLAFKDFDLILSPTSPHPAFKIGAQVNDPLAMYLEDIFLVGASLAGLPAISLPALPGEVKGKSLPIGLQFIAPRFRDEKLLSAAQAIEKILA